VKIVVFDFDKTLIQNDSLTSLFLNISKKNPIYFLIFIALAIFYKLGIITNASLKKTLFKLLIKDKNQIYELINTIIIFKNTMLLDILRFHLDKGDLCIISSGTINEILEKYISDLNLIHPKLLLSSSFYYGSNNEMKYYNNYGVNKIYGIRRLGYSHIDIFFTDNVYADLPLMSISSSVYKISNLKLTKVI
jgi:hypothetical protein